MSFLLEQNRKKGISILLGEHFEVGFNIHPKEVKNATNYLIKSFKEGDISEDVFKNLIEMLLAFYIEQKMDERLIKKMNFPINNYSILQG